MQRSHPLSCDDNQPGSCTLSLNEYVSCYKKSGCIRRCRFLFLPLYHTFCDWDILVLWWRKSFQHTSYHKGSRACSWMKWCRFHLSSHGNRYCCTARPDRCERSVWLVYSDWPPHCPRRALPALWWGSYWSSNRRLPDWKNRSPPKDRPIPRWTWCRWCLRLILCPVRSLWIPVWPDYHCIDPLISHQGKVWISCWWPYISRFLELIGGFYRHLVPFLPSLGLCGSFWTHRSLWFHWISSHYAKSNQSLSRSWLFSSHLFSFIPLIMTTLSDP